MHKQKISTGLAPTLVALFFANHLLFAVGSEGKKSHEKTKLEQDELRASLGTARDSFVKYVSSPAFSIGSEVIIDKIIDFLSEMNTEDIKEGFGLLQTDPTILKRLMSDLEGEAEDDMWSDSEKTYELLRNALKTFYKMENPQLYFQNLIKVIGLKAKEIISTKKDEL